MLPMDIVCQTLQLATVESRRLSQMVLILHAAERCAKPFDLLTSTLTLLTLHHVVNVANAGDPALTKKGKAVLLPFCISSMLSCVLLFCAFMDLLDRDLRS